MLEGGPERYARNLLYSAIFIGFVFLVALSSTVQSVGTVLLLSVGPTLVVLAVLGHLSGVRPVSSWRVFVFGGCAGAVTVLFAGGALVTGSGAVAIPGFGASLFAGAAAVLS